MGITGLIQWVQQATTPSSIQNQLRGKSVAIDSYYLLHKGSYCCSERLVRGVKTSAMIDYAMKYVRMLQSYCGNIIMVFDGQVLQAKSLTNAKRRKNRESAKIKALELAKSGKHNEAKKEFDKAVIITHEHALELMEECRRHNIECIVAMYEADAQLAYLNKIGLAEFIISEDSDLILFGCTKILFKLSLDGKCLLFEHDKLEQTFPKYTFEKFRRICILSGCDYLNNLPGVGLSKAKKFMMMTAETDMRKAIPKIPAYLNLKITLPEDYIENFLRAEATFKYMYVYDPIKKQMVRLNELTNEEDEKYCINAGDLLDPETAHQIALGNINPKTLVKVCDYDPIKDITKNPKKPIQNTKYKPMFSIWKYDGKQQTVNKVKQSKIAFMPVKFKTPENDALESIDMDDIISAYSGQETTKLKKPSSVLEDDLNTSQISSTNPFLKRQSLEKNIDNAYSCSLIKSLGSKDESLERNYKDSRVISRFFSSKVSEELKKNPLDIIERIETTKISKESEIEIKLEENSKFYSIAKRPLDVIKEKYIKSSNNQNVLINESPKETNYESQSLDISSQKKFDISNRKKTVKNNSLTLSHKLSKFGFTKAKKIL